MKFYKSLSVIPPSILVGGLKWNFSVDSIGHDLRWDHSSLTTYISVKRLFRWLLCRKMRLSDFKQQNVLLVFMTCYTSLQHCQKQ